MPSPVASYAGWPRGISSEPKPLDSFFVAQPLTTSGCLILLHWSGQIFDLKRRQESQAPVGKVFTKPLAGHSLLGMIAHALRYVSDVAEAKVIQAFQGNGRTKDDLTLHPAQWSDIGM